MTDHPKRRAVTMEFMGISVGVLALVCALVVLRCKRRAPDIGLEPRRPDRLRNRCGRGDLDLVHD
jgi:hypothetical protein